MIILAIAPVEMSGTAQIDLAADDRLDALAYALLIKFYHAVHYAVVGNS